MASKCSAATWSPRFRASAMNGGSIRCSSFSPFRFSAESVLVWLARIFAALWMVLFIVLTDLMYQTQSGGQRTATSVSKARAFIKLSCALEIWNFIPKISSRSPIWFFYSTKIDHFYLIVQFRLDSLNEVRFQSADQVDVRCHVSEPDLKDISRQNHFIYHASIFILRVCVMHNIRRKIIRGLGSFRDAFLRGALSVCSHH